jgi:hypothetical protein
MGMIGIIIGIRWSLIGHVVPICTHNSFSKYVIISTNSYNNKGREMHFSVILSSMEDRITRSSFHNYGSWNWILPQPWCFSVKWPCLLEASEEVKKYHVNFCEQLHFTCRGFYDRMFSHLHAFLLCFLPSLLKFFDCEHHFTI